jgi:hypothetical protein
MRLSQSERLAAVIVANALCAGIALSQQAGVASSELRAQAIVASFNKSKHMLKEKHGVGRRSISRCGAFLP